MPHPYDNLPDRAFWRSGVARTDREIWPDLYQPKVAVGPDTKIATAGSCFAQHIGRFLRLAGCNVLEAEPAPEIMPDEVARRYGYGLFSGRYGNIYTARQLRQLLEEIVRGKPCPRFAWPLDNRFVDAFRPGVEPEGMASAAEVLLHRDYHLEKTAQMLREADVFIFTLGLTEAWADKATGRVFPVCPGVAGGHYSPRLHEFLNFTHAEILEDLREVRRLLQRFKPGMKMIVTVSPVPLTATASGNHVLTATTWSKATLRSVAGDFADTHDDVDYFPSYELVMTPAAGIPAFEDNMRSVRSEMVERVMGVFLGANGLIEQAPAAPAAQLDDDDEDELVCEELLLQAFSK